jgi:hypothetical protein
MATKFLKFLSVIFSLLAFPAFSQTTPGSEVAMADKMRADGMIYIVVGVLLLIIAGLLIYLITVDKKISRLEKELNLEK